MWESSRIFQRFLVQTCERQYINVEQNSPLKLKSQYRKPFRAVEKLDEGSPSIWSQMDKTCLSACAQLAMKQCAGVYLRDNGLFEVMIADIRAANEPFCYSSIELKRLLKRKYWWMDCRWPLLLCLELLFQSRLRIIPWTGCDVKIDVWRRKLMTHCYQF